MRRDPCLFGGDHDAEDWHHPTGRVAGGRSPYLDRGLVAPLCHDDHELVGDDEKRRADREPDLMRPDATSLDWIEVRLRRLAVFGARCAEAVPLEWLRIFIASLARHLDAWANELNRTIGALDLSSPGWRTLPGLHG
jgi:hypothetical protein